MTDTRAETTFDVPSQPEEAWKALEELRTRAGAPDEWWLPGFACRGSEVEVEQPRRLTVRKLDEPCAGTLIAITFEHVDTGSRIRVVQSGFDEGFIQMAGEGFWSHAEHIFADLHLFFLTRILAERAWLPWAPLGVGVTTEPFGLRVTSVRAGTWAERVGLRADDVLLTIAGAPLYTADDLGVVERVVHPGDDVATTWGRGGVRTEATATV
jgi:hypothetical protein